MKQDKKEILQEQVQKLKEVLKVLEANVDCEVELCDEYSFLSIIKKKFEKFAGK